MSKLRRYYFPGQTYFITCVTYNRNPILIDHANTLQQSLNFASHKTNCELHAWVILPDHLHLVIKPIDGDASAFVQCFKQSFSMFYRKRARVSRPVWQHRFWDHIIRDEQDYTRHLDYIHFNPVKHGLTATPSAYELSSIHQFIENGLYTSDWRVEEEALGGDFGE